VKEFGSALDVATFIQFSKLVADSPTSESVSSILAETIVEKWGGLHALVLGTTDSGGFSLLSSYGSLKSELSQLDFSELGSIAELHDAVIRISGDRNHFRAFPLISNAGLFGVVGVLYTDETSPGEKGWRLIEGLTELTAISLNKAYQHQQLKQALDDLRASQDVMVRTEKFRALGEMSAGIAHDLRNLLNPLQLYTDHMRDVLDNRAELLDALGRMDRVLARGVETVERLKDFSRLRPDESEAVATSLNAMVEEAIEISKPKLAATELILELGSPPTVVLRPADCVTAIVNLIFNAVDAVQGKGRVTLRTGSTSGEAWIEVQDNGPGIPADIRGKILEPLFTTKGRQGTGLGVPIVYAFTQKHGGRLDIESEPGQGARFRMWFPAST
jgi:signal transduction histidine kinase